MNDLLRSTVLSVPALALSVSLSSVQAQTPREPMVYENAAGGPRLLEEGQPLAIIHATVEGTQSARESGTPVRAARAGTSGGNLTYHGGTGGVGVETAPKVYLVFWGS